MCNICVQHPIHFQSEAPIHASREQNAQHKSWRCSDVLGMGRATKHMAVSSTS